MSAEFMTHAKDDFEAIINAEFAEDVVISGETFQGIFDETYADVDVETGAKVMSTQPRVTLVESQIPNGFTQGSNLIIRGHVYKAVELEPDGQGSVMVRLHA